MGTYSEQRQETFKGSFLKKETRVYYKDNYVNRDLLEDDKLYNVIVNEWDDSEGWDYTSYKIIDELPEKKDWWNTVADKCLKCKFFDGYDICGHKNQKYPTVTNETLKNCPLKLYIKEDIKMENNNKLPEFGYHTQNIEKGVLGEFSKVKEEFEELEDAVQQEDKIMILCECSDLIGAIKHFVLPFNISLEDLISFNDKTENAFKTNKR